MRPGCFSSEANACVKSQSEGKYGPGKCGVWHSASLCLLVAVLAWGQCVRAAGSPGERQGDVFRTTLNNGLRLVIVRHPIAPVVTTVVNYLVGASEAPDGLPGTAHALEHMMFRGSPGLSAHQLAALTAAMGGMFDANTRRWSRHV